MFPSRGLDDVLGDLDFADDDLHVQTLIGELRVGLRRALASLSRHGVYVVDMDGTLRSISRSGARILGYDPEELIGKHTHPIFHHHRRDGSEYPAEQCSVRQVTEPVLLENECLWTKDGTKVCAYFRAQPVLDKAGVQQATMVFFEKIKHVSR